MRNSIVARTQGRAETAIGSTRPDTHRNTDPSHLAAGVPPESGPFIYSVASGLTVWQCGPSCRRSTRSRCVKRCCVRDIAAARRFTLSADEDLAGATILDKNVTEVRTAVAHGQMPATTLDDIMSALFYGKYDVSLSTTIIEFRSRYSDRQDAHC